MTPTIRRAHRIMWAVLAIILPIGFVSTLQLDTNPPIQQKSIELPLAAPLPLLVRTIEKSGLQANLRKDSQLPDHQLELLVRQPFEAPSVVVRIVTRTNELAIGTLDVAGIYRFTLPDSNPHPTITLVDEIEHKVLQTIHF